VRFAAPRGGEQGLQTEGAPCQKKSNPISTRPFGLREAKVRGFLNFVPPTTSRGSGAMRVDALRHSLSSQRLALRLQAEAALALLGGRDAKVADEAHASALFPIFVTSPTQAIQRSRSRRDGQRRQASAECRLGPFLASQRP
jgi:hypothetical protein